MIRDLLRPWREASTWWTLTHLLLDVAVGTVAFTVVFALLVTSVVLLLTFPLAIPVAWLLVVSARALAQLERSRVGALLGVAVDDPVPPLAARTAWARLAERLRSGARWREVAYHLLALPRGLLTSIVAGAAWCGSAALLLLPLYVSSLPGGSAKFGLFEVSQGPGAALAALVGLSGLAVAAPWITLGLGRLDVATARWLLGPRPDAELGERLSRLETSRAAALDSAEAERRRIERDLHDGAQQRLVALAMSLGLAKEKLNDLTQQDTEASSIAAGGAAISQRDGNRMADYLSVLPPLNVAEQQMELGYLLGSVRYTTLGAYGRHDFTDPRVEAPLRAFQERLAGIARTIEQRNLVRRPYTALAPAGVPQSINI